jgi:hypothetical protein
MKSMKKLINLLLLFSMVLGGILMPASINVGSSYSDSIDFNTQIAYAQQNDFTNTSLSAECSSWEVGCHIGNFFLWLFDLIWFKTTQVFAFISGFVLDVLLYHSISSATYRTGIIESGWEILRDFVNIVFIFSLLFIAFKMVFGAGSKVKSYLIKTILIALIINFSLFITYTVMDASNLLANIFYSRISTDGQVNSQSELTVLDEFFEEQSRKSPSAAIVNNFNPQIIVQGIGDVGFFQKFIMVFAAGAVNIMMIWLFVNIIFLFLGRTVGLILSAIMAPLAFATLTIPSSGATNLRFVGFNKWIKELLSLSFMAPIYLFFLYLIVEFAKDDALFNSISIAGNTGDGAGNVINLIIGVLLPFALIGVLLYTAKKITTLLAGDLGSRVSEGVTKLAAGAATVTAAGAAIAATGGLAAAGGAARLAGTRGSGINNFGRMLQTKKFDLSKVPGFNRMAKNVPFGSKVATFANTSYADIDTSARKGVNSAKSMYSDMSTNRVPESVQKWQDTVAESNDQFTAREIENNQRKAKSEAETDKKKDIRIKTAYDPSIDRFWYVKDKYNLEKLLKEKQEQWAKMDSSAKKAEKKRIADSKQPLEADLEYKRQQIKSTDKPSERARLQKEADGIKKKIEDIENTSVEGVIAQVEKALDKVANDARAETLSSKSSKKASEQASRVGSGKVKTSPKIGRDYDK